MNETCSSHVVAFSVESMGASFHLRSMAELDFSVQPNQKIGATSVMAILVQLGHPKINQGAFQAFARVKDVFLHLFRAEEESIYLFWHTIPLRIRYREELYQNFDSILAMVWLIQRDERGATTVHFTNQLLRFDWEIRWAEGEVTVRGVFAAHDELYTPYADALNQAPEVTMAKEAFLNEWKTLLHQVIVAFQAGEVVIQDGTERRKREMLQRVEGQIAQYGQLYIRPS